MGPDREELNAWIDGRLSGERLRRMERLLEQDPQAREEAQAWREQADALRALGREALDEPIPPRLLEAAGAGRGGTLRSATIRDPRLWLAAAALAALAWSVGWVSHARYGVPEPVRIAREVPPPFVRDAFAAHVVYTPEVRHPVEVAAAQHEHLVQWLSKRLGARLVVPSLETAGWSLVGGRLLPGGEGARAQFMYETASGARMTLYVADAGAESGDTAFRFDSDGRVSAFYWIDGRFGYTLSAQLDRSALLGLAEEVYRQLSSPRAP